VHGKRNFGKYQAYLNRYMPKTVAYAAAHPTESQSIGYLIDAVHGKENVDKCAVLLQSETNENGAIIPISRFTLNYTEGSL
jgi:hypothetical protein